MPCQDLHGSNPMLLSRWVCDAQVVQTGHLGRARRKLCLLEAGSCVARGTLCRRFQLKYPKSTPMLHPR